MRRARARAAGADRETTGGVRLSAPGKTLSRGTVNREPADIARASRPTPSACCHTSAPDRSLPTVSAPVHGNDGKSAEATIHEDTDMWFHMGTGWCAERDLRRDG